MYNWQLIIVNCGMEEDEIHLKQDISLMNCQLSIINYQLLK
jgi:hypothetical protein